MVKYSGRGYSVMMRSGSGLRRKYCGEVSKSAASLFDEAFMKTNLSEMSFNDKKIKNRLLVFYDGGCPLCSREIAFYNKINRNSEANIAFINLEEISPLSDGDDKMSNTSSSRLKELTTKYNISVPAAYRRIHALGEDGSVHTSAKALCEIWTRLNYWWILGLFMRKIPGVLPLADSIYEFFAEKRFKWRQQLPSSVACSLIK